MEAACAQEHPPPVGTNIRIARQLRDLSQAKLAAALGIARTRIADYEAGNPVPTWNRVVEIARATGIPDPGWFYLEHPELAPKPDD